MSGEAGDRLLVGVAGTTLTPLLVSAADAARMLGIGKSLLYEMQADGRLGPMSLSCGRRRLYRVDELRRWVEAGCPTRCKWLKDVHDG